MAGVTDFAQRALCREHGAAVAVSEMIGADPRLRTTDTARRRLVRDGEPRPWVVQIAGALPAQLAEAARYHEAHGADVIDINMGCPAKKVCGHNAGSALLKDVRLVARILDAVVGAVSLPVTLKIRTGWDRQHRNALEVARLAEQCGIQVLTVHGRTRADGFHGVAEFRSVTEIKRAIAIPVIANGDIDCAPKAARVLNHTAADAVMIGRAAQGNPWIFREINHYLCHGRVPARPRSEEIRRVVLRHVEALYSLYGEDTGALVARKHLRRYLEGVPGGAQVWNDVKHIDKARAQHRLLGDSLRREVPGAAA